MNTIVPTQPCGYGELLGRSLKLYFIGFPKIILISILFAIVVFIPRMLSIMGGADIFRYASIYRLNSFWVLLVEFVSTFLFITIIWHMYCVMMKRREPLIEDVMVGVKKVVYLFIATLIETMLIIASFLLLFSIHLYAFEHNVIPLTELSFVKHAIFWVGGMLFVFYVATLFVFLPPLIAVENKGVVGSLEKSVYLGWNHSWRIFSTQMTPWLLYFLLLSILKYKFNIDLHLYFTETTPHSLWGAVTNIVIFAIFIPWVAALLLVQLKDLELRKEIAA